MKMDTLSWTQLNPDIAVQPTVKLAYGRYAYRMEISCVGMTYLRGGFRDMDDFLQVRANARQMNWGGSWRLAKMRSPGVTEQQVLIQLQELLEQYSGRFKQRIEEPVLQLYADNVNDLLSFARQLKYPDYLVSVMMPRNTHERQLLESGLVIRRKPVTWNYRFHIREARYSWECRQQLYQYLKNLEDDVHLPQSLWDRLVDPKNTYIWGGYIDANDRNLATFIHLINAHFIRSIDEFHEVAQGK